jgi:hypothetical protein
MGYLERYATVILSIGFITLGLCAYFFPMELAKKSGLAEFFLGILVGIFLLTRKGKAN